MAIDYRKFDKMIDIEGLKKDLAEAEANNGGGEYREVPHGNYEVKITKLELGETGPNSKNPGSPMVKVWFKILSGEYEGSLIFMNQVITMGFQLHIVKDFLKSLESSLEVEFDNWVQFEQLLMDIAEDIDTQGMEYALEYGEKKGFNTYKITEVFDAN